MIAAPLRMENMRLPISRNQERRSDGPPTRRSAWVGFTLLELVIVVLILGILAAIAAPKILVNTQEAAGNAAQQTLNTVRDALELYRAQSGTWPQPADSAGLHAALNPYLRGSVFPRVTIGGKNSNAVVLDKDDDPTVTTGPEGWVYSKSSGEILINASQEVASMARGVEETSSPTTGVSAQTGS